MTKLNNRYHITKKGVIKRNSGIKVPDNLDVQATDWGYNQAIGKEGTGWMLYRKGDFKGDVSSDNDLDDFSDGWTETNQFDYEMKRKFSFIEKLNKDNPDFLDALSTIRSSFAIGYSTAIKEIESN